jgi:hypothetical protein
MGQATGEDIVRKVMSCIGRDNLPLERFQEIGEESPNFAVIFRHFFLVWPARYEDFQNC